MLDIVFSLSIVAFFFVAIGYLHFCGKLAGKGAGKGVAKGERK